MIVPSIQKLVNTSTNYCNLFVVNLIWIYFKQCPSESEKSEFIKALKDGTITYHAGPMNMQPENMDQMLFEMSLNLSVNLDTMLDIERRYRTLSQRDVPGMVNKYLSEILALNLRDKVSIKMMLKINQSIN